MWFLPYFGCVLLGVDSLRGGLAEGNRILTEGSHPNVQRCCCLCRALLHHLPKLPCVGSCLWTLYWRSMEAPEVAPEVAGSFVAVPPPRAAPPCGSCPCPPPTPHPPYVPQVEHCFVRSRVASGCRSQVLCSTSAAVIDLRCVAPAVLTVKTERRDSILEGVPAPMHLARTGPGATIPYHTHPPYVPQALCAHGPARRPQDQVHPCGLHRREALPADGL